MRDPVVLEAVRGLRSGHVIHEERTLGPLKGTVLDAAVAFLAEHVPDHERQVGRPSRRLDPQVFLRHFRPDRGDVIVENLSTTKRRTRLVFPTAPSPRSKIFRLMRSSTMATSLHAGATLITVAGSMSGMRIRRQFAWKRSRDRRNRAAIASACGRSATFPSHFARMVAWDCSNSHTATCNFRRMPVR